MPLPKILVLTITLPLNEGNEVHCYSDRFTVFSKNRPGHTGEKRYGSGPMTRYWAILIVGLWLAGCTNQDVPTSDPFLVGRTRIPPPATGSAVGNASDPYYRNSTAGVPPGWQPTGTAPSSTSAISPPSATSVSGATPSGSAVPSAAAPPATASGTTAAPSSSSVPGMSYPGMMGGTSARGVSLQGARSAVASPTTPTASLRSTTAGTLDDRMPRPIEGASVGSGTARPQPIVRTLQPRSVSESATPRPAVNIADLPAAD